MDTFIHPTDNRRSVTTAPRSRRETADSLVRTDRTPIVQRVCVALVGLALLLLSGCMQLRVPAIDPTGSRLFAPGGTTLTPPCPLSEDGCLSGLGNLPCLSGSCLTGSCLTGSGRSGSCTCFSCLGKWLPEPAFQEPATPPPCLDGRTPGASPLGAPTNCVPGGAPYSADCANGPPAILVGQRGCLKNYATLPKSGKRGRLLLSPARVVAPVGGEVILLSGVCGNDGYLATGEQIEWMLTQDSVGHFIQIAPDDAGLLQRLSNKAEVEKLSGSFARGVTRTKPALITRGTLTPDDDVRLDAGQAWATISSPSEGVSHITALAPDSDCWDQRKATATIYWVDAAFQFPGPQSVAAGSPVVLSTRVTRSEGSIPAVGWKVRYTILNPELGGFAPSGAATVDAVVDESGFANATLSPVPGTSGTATIAMEVIRPAGIDNNVPELPLGSGQTLVTWSAPQLDIAAQAPAVAGFEQPIDVLALVANPGNLATGPVEVNVQLPLNVQLLNTDLEHEVLGNQIIWRYPNGIPPGQEGPIRMQLSAREPFRLQFTARDLQNNLTASSEVAVDVSVPSLDVDVQPTPDSERITVGEDAEFEITVTNTGQRSLTGIELEVAGDQGMSEINLGQQTVYNERQEALQPGDTWRIPVIFNVYEPGQRCLSVTAQATGQAPASAQACIIAQNPVPEVSTLEARITGPTEVRINETGRVTYIVSNPGREAVNDVDVTVTYEANVDPVQATDAYRGSNESKRQYQLKWRIPIIQPGTEQIILVDYQALGPEGVTSTFVTANSAENARANADFEYRVAPAAPVQPIPLDSPNVPPTAGQPRVPFSSPTPSNPFNGSTNDPGASGGVRASPFTPNGASLTPLSLTIFDANDPVTRGGEVRYQITVTNNTSVDDADIAIRFALANDVSIVSVTETQTGQDAMSVATDGWYILNPVPVLRPNQNAQYTLVLRADRPQTMGVAVQVRSRRMPQWLQATEETKILP